MATPLSPTTASDLRAPHPTALDRRFGEFKRTFAEVVSGDSRGAKMAQAFDLPFRTAVFDWGTVKPKYSANAAQNAGLMLFTKA